MVEIKERRKEIIVGGAGGGIALIILTILFFTSGQPDVIYSVKFYFPDDATCDIVDCFIEGNVSHNFTQEICFPRSRLKGEFPRIAKQSQVRYWGNVFKDIDTYGWVEQNYTCQHDFSCNPDEAWCWYVDGNGTNTTIFYISNWTHGNLQTKTIWWNEWDVNGSVWITEEDWKAIPSEICLQTNTNYSFRIDFKKEPWSSGKFNVSVRLPDSMGGTIFLLDPWWSDNYSKKVVIRLENLDNVDHVEELVKIDYGDLFTTELYDRKEFRLLNDTDAADQETVNITTLGNHIGDSYQTTTTGLTSWYHDASPFYQSFRANRSNISAIAINLERDGTGDVSGSRTLEIQSSCDGTVLCTVPIKNHGNESNISTSNDFVNTTIACNGLTPGNTYFIKFACSGCAGDTGNDLQVYGAVDTPTAYPYGQFLDAACEGTNHDVAFKIYYDNDSTFRPNEKLAFTLSDTIISGDGNERTLELYYDDGDAVDLDYTLDLNNPYYDTPSNYTVGAEESAPSAQTCQNLNTPNEYYQMSGNINNHATSCFNITTDNVTLDCAGYTIDGTEPAAGTASAVNATNNINNITVANCTLKDSRHGVRFDGVDGSTIKNITVPSMEYYAIYIRDSLGNTITNNSINLGRGIYLHLSDSNNVTNNKVNTNSVSGLYMTASHSNRIINNTLDGFSSGLNNQGGDKNTFTNVTFFGRTTDGVLLSAFANNNAFTNCTFIGGTGVGDQGLYLDSTGGSNNNFTNSTIQSLSSYSDINITGGTNNIFLNTTFDTVKISAGAELVRSWYVRANVTTGGSGTSSNVTFENRTGVKIGTNQTSDSGTGLTPWVALTEYKNVSGTTFRHTNYTASASASGYASDSTSFNFSNNIIVNITLQPSGPPPLPIAFNWTDEDSTITVHYTNVTVNGTGSLDTCTLNFNGTLYDMDNESSTRFFTYIQFLFNGNFSSIYVNCTNSTGVYNTTIAWLNVSRSDADGLDINVTITPNFTRIFLDITSYTQDNVTPENQSATQGIFNVTANGTTALGGVWIRTNITINDCFTVYLDNSSTLSTNTRTEVTENWVFISLVLAASEYKELWFSLYLSFCPGIFDAWALEFKGG